MAPNAGPASLARRPRRRTGRRRPRADARSARGRPSSPRARSAGRRTGRRCRRLLVGPGIGIGGARRSAQVVEAMQRAGLAVADHHEAAAAAEAGHERLDDGQGRCDGDGRVDGVPAIHQGSDPACDARLCAEATTPRVPTAGARNAPWCGPVTVVPRRGAGIAVAIAALPGSIDSMQRTRSGKPRAGGVALRPSPQPSPSGRGSRAR